MVRMKNRAHSASGENAGNPGTPLVADMQNDGEEPEELTADGAQTGHRTSGNHGDAGDLLQQLEAKEQEARENYEKYVRTLAEFDNARKRLRQEKDDAIEYANANLVLQLLPIMDNFELALQHSETSRDFDVLFSGLKQILKQMKETLRKQGVEPIESVGKPFDPDIHEAIGHAESDEYEEGAVAEELRTGYRMKNRTIRPSIVRVVGG